MNLSGVCLAGLSFALAFGLKAETAGTFDWRDGKPFVLSGTMVCETRDGLVAPADRPGDFRYEIVAKGPGKLSVRFERHVDGKVLPVYGAGANFVLSGREKTCTAEHTVPAGAWDALVLTGENIEVASVKVTPLERREAPELMRTADGQPVKDRTTWEKTRRREIRELFENEIYGRRPAERPARLSFAAAEPDKVMMDGKAVRKRVRITSVGPYGTNAFAVTAFVPVNRKPAPAFLLVCNRPPHKNIDPDRKEKSEFWPAEEIVDRGYAAVAFFNGDVTTDARWDFTNGVYGVVNQNGAVCAWKPKSVDCAFVGNLVGWRQCGQDHEMGKTQWRQWFTRCRFTDNLSHGLYTNKRAASRTKLGFQN